jgi:hypothetical protein
VERMRYLGDARLCPNCARWVPGSRFWL